MMAALARGTMIKGPGSVQSVNSIIIGLTPSTVNDGSEECEIRATSVVLIGQMGASLPIAVEPARLFDITRYSSTLYIGIASLFYHTEIPIFTFSFNPTYNNIKVKITIKLTPNMYFDVVCV